MSASTPDRAACVIIAIDHMAEDSNAASPTTYVNPVSVLYVHNSMDKAQLRFQEIIGEFKKTSGTETCKYVLEFKAPTCVEVREIYTGWVKNTKIRTKTISLLSYKYDNSN